MERQKTLQTQCIAIGDGTDYKKYLQNPVGDIVYAFQRGVVLKISVILKIWKENDRYYMVVGSRSRDGVGQAVLFFADKLDEWK